MFVPREGDLPLDDLVKMAEKAIADSGGTAEVFFKFTCSHCGERCTFTEPNQLFEYGECCKCGKETVVLFGGFNLHIHLDKTKNT